MFYHFEELKVTLVVPNSRKKWFSWSPIYLKYSVMNLENNIIVEKFNTFSNPSYIF